MYTSTELAKMYKTTIVTVNRKFKDKSLSNYVVKEKSKSNGKYVLMLKEEGLNQFQLLMVNSKVYQSVSSKKDDVNLSVSTPQTVSQNPTSEQNINYTPQDLYVESLKDQIKKQDEQIEYLKEQLESRDIMLSSKDEVISKKDDVIIKHTLLVEHSQKLLEQKEKLLLESKEQKEQSWFKRIFNK